MSASFNSFATARQVAFAFMLYIIITILYYTRKIPQHDDSMRLKNNITYSFSIIQLLLLPAASAIFYCHKYSLSRYI